MTFGTEASTHREELVVCSGDDRTAVVAISIEML